MFLGTYKPLYRQPYSGHMFVDRCMFDRHMEKRWSCHGVPAEERASWRRRNRDPRRLGVLPIVGPLHCTSAMALSWSTSAATRGSLLHDPVLHRERPQGRVGG
jgi:hypothetical protein